MDKITRENIRTLKREVEEALQPLADKHGISITMGRGSFNATNATLKVEVATKDEDGVSVSREAEQWTHFAPRYGIAPDAVGKTVRGGLDQTFTIIGWNSRAKRYPVIAQCNATQKRYKLPASLVAAQHPLN